MADGMNLFGGITGAFSGFSGIFLVILIALGAIAICGTILWLIWRWKSWNLKVEFKLPRAVNYLKPGEKIDINNISGFVDYEWGKGSYNAKTGVVWLKRKGKKKIAMKPFNLAACLQGKDGLTVIQIGSTDYIPVIPQSFMIFEDENGKESSLLNLKADTSESKAWKNSFERDAKKAYSIMGLLSQYLPIIGLGLVILLWGIQFILLRKSICGG